MPKLINVTHALWLDEERTCPLRPPHTTALGAWAELPTNAEEVVKTLCCDWLNETTWEEWFGTDDTYQTIWATVSAPAWLQGCYEVQLRRIMQAVARKIVTQQPENRREEEE